jgi:holo-[acyl-carrier protein] synthase
MGRVDKRFMSDIHLIKRDFRDLCNWISTPPEDGLSKLLPLEVKGVGVDLVIQSRIKHVIERHGDVFGKRILTDDEFHQWIDKNRSINFLAKRFCAKEAVSKSLGTGIADGVGFHSMSLQHTVKGQPFMMLSGEALKWAQKLQVNERVFLSITDDKEYVIAFSVLDKCHEKNGK